MMDAPFFQNGRAATVGLHFLETLKQSSLEKQCTDDGDKHFHTESQGGEKCPPGSTSCLCTLSYMCS